MLKDQDKERFCVLTIQLNSYSGESTTYSYSAKDGIKRIFTLSGHIDHRFRRASAFDGRFVRLEFNSPPGPEWLGLPSGISHACGVARVNVGVDPRTFELDDRTIEDHAIRVLLAVSPDAFEAIRSQVVEAYDHRRILNASVTLIGDSLPQTEINSPLDLELEPEDLDVSKVHDYYVRDFRIWDTGDFDHQREHGREK